MSGSALDRLLQAEQLPSVCLLSSKDPLLLQEAGDQLRERAKALGFLERDVFDVDGRFNWQELASAASTMSLFSSRRILEVRLPTGKPGREGSDAIRAFCESPPPDTLLLVLAADWSKQHEGAWTKSVAKHGFVFPIPQMRSGQLPAWINARLRSRGLQADNDAVLLLAERVEGNLLAAAQEIDKLALLAAPRVGEDSSGTPPARVNLQQMERLVADSARFEPFALIDVALSGDLARSLRMLRSLRAEGAVVYQLLGPINHALSQLAGFAEVQRTGGNVASAMQQARLWDSKQSLYRRSLDRATPSYWSQILADLGRIDRMSKGREYGDAWQGLERLLAGVAQPASNLRP